MSKQPTLATTQSDHWEDTHNADLDAVWTVFEELMHQSQELREVSDRGTLDDLHLEELSKELRKVADGLDEYMTDTYERWTERFYSPPSEPA